MAQCKLKLFGNSFDKPGEIVEKSIGVPEACPFPEVLKSAHKVLNYSSHIPLKQCRLVKYNSFSEILDESLDLEEFGDQTFGQVVGGARNYSSFRLCSFELFLETRSENEQFKKYNKGGMSIKILHVDLDTGDISTSVPSTIRAEHEWTLTEFKQHVGELFDLNPAHMTCALEMYNYSRPMTNDSSTLWEEGLFRKHTVFVSADPHDCQNEYIDSQMCMAVEEYVNSVLLNITLPPIQQSQQNGNKIRGWRDIQCKVDSTTTVAELKEKLKKCVGVGTTFFKLYRVYDDDQEHEMEQLSDTVMPIPFESKIIVRLDRAEKHRVKLFLLRVNHSKYFEFMMECVVANNTSIKEFKKQIVAEAIQQGVQLELGADRMRLRKKVSYVPGTVYVDDLLIDKHVYVYTGCEMFLELLDEEEQMKSAKQLQVYVRRWHPSEYKLDPLQDVVLDTPTPDELVKKVSALSGIPVDLVSIAKGAWSFQRPANVPVDLENDLDWAPPIKLLSYSTFSMYDTDGGVVYFKNSSEKLAKAKTHQLEPESLGLQDDNASNAKAVTETNDGFSGEQGIEKIISENDDTLTKLLLENQRLKEHAIQLNTKLKVLQDRRIAEKQQVEIEKQCLHERTTQLSTELKVLQDKRNHEKRQALLQEKRLKEHATQLGTELKTLQDEREYEKRQTELQGERFKERTTQLGIELQALLEKKIREIKQQAEFERRCLQERTTQLSTELRTLQDRRTKESQEAKIEKQSLQQRITELVAEVAEQDEERKEIVKRMEKFLEYLKALEDELEKAHASWKVKHDEVTVTQHELGRGGWGVIRIGQFREQRVAVKQMHEAIISQVNPDLLHREINTMAQLRHPNLLQFIGAVMDHPSGTPMIITEIMDMSLRKAYEDELLTRDEACLPICLRIMRDVAVLGLNYLHCLPNPIIHRDVSSANVLLESKGNNKWKTKISDFGSANEAKQAMTKATGAAVYCAPESLQSVTAVKKRLTTKMDVFSYGVLFCEALNCIFPDVDIFLRMLRRIKAQYPSLYELIESCLEDAPSTRPTMKQVVQYINSLRSHDELYHF